jgi:ABC-2 type transport system permease protein
MRLRKAWIVTMKDFGVVSKSKHILYSLIAMPLVMSIGLPLVVLTMLAGTPITVVASLLGMFTAFFAVMATMLPTVIASYSFVGEKVERSLEPLLATPTTDGELLLGKCLAAFLPSMAATLIGAAGYVTVIDLWSYMNQGPILLPNLNLALMVGLVAPLACILSVEANVIVSSRVSDVRAAEQLGGMVASPIILVLMVGSFFAFMPAELLALVMSGVLAIAAVALFYVSKATFRREEILTRWK